MLHYLRRLSEWGNKIVIYILAVDFNNGAMVISFLIDIYMTSLIFGG